MSSQLHAGPHGSVTDTSQQRAQLLGDMPMQTIAHAEKFQLAQGASSSVSMSPTTRSAELGHPYPNHVADTDPEGNPDRLAFLQEDIRFEQLHRADPLAIGPLVDSRDVYFAVKRLLDLGITATALIFLAPLMAVIALIIAWDSPGPVIFKQQRVGAKPKRHNGRLYWQRQDFTFLKFRSMRTDASPDLHRQFVQAYIEGDADKMTEVQPDKQGADMFKLNGDPRVTKVGKFLRKTSLDELPQLWNVLQGHMSLVGPRPPIPYEVEMYSDESMKRLATIPGITGLWQMMGRGELGFNEQVELDVEYIERQSTWLDLKILVGTIPAVLLSKGAK